MKKTIIAMSVLAVLSVNIAHADDDDSKLKPQVEKNTADIAAHYVDIINNNTTGRTNSLAINDQRVIVDSNTDRIAANKLTGSHNAQLIKDQRVVIDENAQITLTNANHIGDYNTMHSVTGAETLSEGIVNNHRASEANAAGIKQVYTDANQAANEAAKTIKTQMQQGHQQAFAVIRTEADKEINTLNTRIDEVAAKGFDDSQIRQDGQKYVDKRFTALNSNLNEASKAVIAESGRLESLSANNSQDIDSLYKGVSQNFHATKDLKLEQGVMQREGEAAYTALEQRIKDSSYDDSTLRAEGQKYVTTRLNSLDNSVQTRMQDLSGDVDNRFNAAYTTGADVASDLNLRIDSINTNSAEKFVSKDQLYKGANDAAKAVKNAMQQGHQQAFAVIRTEADKEISTLNTRIDEVAAKGFDDSQIRKDGQQYVDKRFTALNGSLTNAYKELKTDSAYNAEQAKYAQMHNAQQDLDIKDVASSVELSHKKINDQQRHTQLRTDQLDAEIKREVKDRQQVVSNLDHSVSENVASINLNSQNLDKAVIQGGKNLRQAQLDNKSARIGLNQDLRQDGKEAYEALEKKIQKGSFDDTKLRAAGAREVANLESSISGLQKTGEIAYNKLRAEGGREVANLESSITGLNKAGEVAYADLDKRIDEVATNGYDDTKLRAAGAREVANLESSITGLNKAGEVAYADLDKRIDEVATNGYDDKKIRADGQAAYDDVLAKGEGAYKDLAEKGQSYVDTKFNTLNDDFKDAKIAMVAVQNQTRKNHEFIGDNRQRIADNAAAIKDAKNSGGSGITEADIEAANKAVDAKIAKATKVDVDAVTKEVEKVAERKIDEAIAKVDMAEVEKAVEAAANKAIEKAVAGIDTDKAIKDFTDYMNSFDKSIRADGAAQVARLDGRIDQNSKAIEQNSKKIEALENRIDGFQDYMNENAAMTNALSGLPQPYNVGKIQVGVGLGFASDKKAVAVGFGYRATEAIVIRGGISKSAGSRSDTQGNIAIGYEF